MGQVYPDYSPNQGIMRAPLIRVTIGDYLYRVPGFIESINLTIENDTPWEINLEGSNDVAQLPQVVDIAVTFRPILDVLPKRPSILSNLTTTTNATTEVAVDTTSVTTAVAPLIANVPRSSPQDPDTFIKPTVSRQFSTQRSATLAELAAVDPALRAQLESATPTDAVIPINPI